MELKQNKNKNTEKEENQYKRSMWTPISGKNDMFNLQLSPCMA